MRKARGGGGVLGVALLAGVVLLAGCGGKSGSSTTSSSAQTVKRLEVHVVRGGSAEAPRRFMLARIADLLGWPQVAEASSGIPGCTVAAGGGSAVTDADGNATLTSIAPFTFVTITCPPNLPANIPLSGPAGAVVKAEIEVGSIEVKVKNQQVSQPSTPSPPSQPSKNSS